MANKRKIIAVYFKEGGVGPQNAGSFRVGRDRVKIEDLGPEFHITLSTPMSVGEKPRPDTHYIVPKGHVKYAEFEPEPEEKKP